MMEWVIEDLFIGKMQQQMKKCHMKNLNKKINYYLKQVVKGQKEAFIKEHY